MKAITQKKVSGGGRFPSSIGDRSRLASGNCFTVDLDAELLEGTGSGLGVGSEFSFAGVFVTVPRRTAKRILSQVDLNFAARALLIGLRCVGERSVVLARSVLARALFDRLCGHALVDPLDDENRRASHRAEDSVSSADLLGATGLKLRNPRSKA